MTNQVTASEICTMEFNFQGRPFIEIGGPGTYPLEMDYTYEGRPFTGPSIDSEVPPEPTISPINQWFMMF